MKNENIPKATAKRLSIYYRYLKILCDAGEERISSKELSSAVKIDSTTIRRDFSYLGALGKRGLGYDIALLVNFLKKLLKQDDLINVALIGVGNFGHALLNFNFHKNSNVRISAAFDINKEIVGTVQSGVPVYPVEELVEQLLIQQIEVAILTVPAKAAQKSVDQLMKANVKGILNFTPVRINVPKSVLVQNVDLTNELQTLVYFLYNAQD